MIDQHMQYADETEFAMALAQKQTEEALLLTLENSKKELEMLKDPSHCGVCYYCGSEVGSGQSFCSPALLMPDEIDYTIYKPSAEEMRSGKPISVDECRISYKKEKQKTIFKQSIGAHLDFGD